MWRSVAMLGSMIWIVALSHGLESQAPATGDVTFTKDVAPILYSSCTYCHRPGEIAPMSLRTYTEVRPWARAIRRAVETKRMPPWHADPHFGAFQNDKSLNARGIGTILAWVDGGAVEGNPADLPALPTFADGWQIGSPSLVVLAPVQHVPARGTIPWLNVDADYVFPEDVWVQAVEVRPGHRRVVHHATVSLIDPNPAPGEPASQNLHLYSPGLDAMIWREGYGKRIPKGSRISFNLHYNTIGTPVEDQTRLGLVFAQAPVHTEVRTSTLQNDRMLVPPMASRHEVISAFRIPSNIRIHALRPHMHLRGKTAAASLVDPDGRRRAILHIPKWDDAWQQYYMLLEPATVTKGTVLEYVATFDNSPANPLNPDPTKPVAWGQQVWEEMQSFWLTWTEITDRNRNDQRPIHVPVNKAFTTGIPQQVR